MANIYVRSTDGLDADNGSTWALAKATLVGADGIDAAGDTIFLSQVHSENTAGNISTGLAGSATSPERILCGNDGAEPPTALATGAIVKATGDFGTMLLSNVGYWYGISFRGGTSTDSFTINISSSSVKWQTFEQCDFQILGTGVTNGYVQPSGPIEWIGCNVKFSATAHGIGTYGAFHWNGGAMVAGSTTPTTLFAVAPASNTIALIENVDLSGFSAGMNLFTCGGANNGLRSGTPRVVIRNSKLPASWSGTLITGTIAFGERFEMYNCDATSTNYRLWIEDYSGSIKNENTIIRTSGANDGTTGLSWKMTSSANAKQPLFPLRSPEIVQWNDTTGSKTVTVEIVHDSLTALNNDEVWVEVEYLGSASAPVGTHVTNYKAGVLTTAAAQASSTATWTTTGITNVNKQKLAVTFTANQKGFIHARVMLGKASYTVYADPMMTVS